MATHWQEFAQTPLGRELCRILPPATRRMIIDIHYDDAVKVYYECFADNALLELNWENALSGAEVISAKDVKG